MTAAIPYALAALSVAQGVSGYASGKKQEKEFDKAAQAATEAANLNFATNMESAKAQVATIQAQAAAGGSLTGSGGDVAETTMKNYTKDAVTKRYNDMLTAWEYSNKAKAAGNSATSALIGGFVGAGTSYFGAKSMLTAGTAGTAGATGAAGAASTAGASSGKLVSGSGLASYNDDWVRSIANK